MKKKKEIFGFSILMLTCVFCMVASICFAIQLNNPLMYILFGMVALSMWVGSALFAIEIKEISDSKYVEPTRPERF